MTCSVFALAALASAGSALAQGSKKDLATPHFDRQVAPLLAQHCLNCHSGTRPKGGLDLTRRKTVLAGGDTGPAVVPGQLDRSVLWQHVLSGKMPPKKPLSGEAREILRAWIRSGAAWGTDPIDPHQLSSDQRAGLDWWSLQPVRQPRLPEVKKRDWPRNAVDWFVLARLEAEGLEPSPAAAPRALVRRLYFDLLGLPPTPEQVEAFVRDPSDTAYLRLVDELLASPHYGERWARHWLDVVRYGESDGFERNNPRPHAWPYRDWVVEALNEDLPYDSFTRLQLAADVVRPGDFSTLRATGFLVAGIHNTVVGSNEVMRRNARQDELEEAVGTLGQAFLGLTVQCARCHDHKFDPIRMTDYYRMTATLAGVEHGEQKFTPSRQTGHEAELRQQLAALDQRLATFEQAARKRLPSLSTVDATLPVMPLARWRFEGDARDEMGGLHGELKGGAEIVGGRLRLNGSGAHVVTAPLARDLREKTLEAWLVLTTVQQRGGGVITVEAKNGAVFDSIVFGERLSGNWTAGSNHFQRTRDLAGVAEVQPGTLVHMAAVYDVLGNITLYRNGLPYAPAYRPAGATGQLQTYAAGDARVLFGMRHSGGSRPFLHGEIEEARLFDRALTAKEVEESARHGPNGSTVAAAKLLALLTAAERVEYDEARAQRVRLHRQLNALPEPGVTPLYVVKSQRHLPPTHVLDRGDVQKPLERVSAGGVAAVGAAEFPLSGDAPEADRRRALADWITRPDNPLFARVLVNRLWHHHFGTGLVETPSDFGFNGGRPSHPELLDWLADTFVRQGFQRKALHRLLVTSSTYRQDSRPRAEGLMRDSANRLLWRKTPYRLEAEPLRDALLAAAGELNPALGGPGFHDVRTYFNSGTTFYEPIDPVGFAFQRRTLYRFSPRGERSALLETFDCPDPSAAMPRRAVTTTPLQALSLFNSSFVLRMADQLATRLAGETPDAAEQVELAYRRALGRVPSAAERQRAARFVAEHGLAALCRVLFNSNEFVFIE